MLAKDMFSGKEEDIFSVELTVDDTAGIMSYRIIGLVHWNQEYRYPIAYLTDWMNNYEEAKAELKRWETKLKQSRRSEQGA